MGPEDMLTSFLAGAMAGLVVDFILHPIDTIKTRLQAEVGFWKAGGFKGIYNGLSSSIGGAIVSAAVFFFSYDFTKSVVPTNMLVGQIIASCIAEAMACIARIPFEIVKQKSQTMEGSSDRQVLLTIIRTEGVSALFAGYGSMVLRDIPFTIIQMPIWEYIKAYIMLFTGGKIITGFYSGASGSLAGAIAGALTTPLDVAKTRIILSQKEDEGYSENPFRVLVTMVKEEGASAMFSGLTPRVTMLGLGGFIFFGTYEFMKNFLTKGAL